jgi:pteridine reductase
VKVALVTGAGRRLGRALALGLGRAGFTVAVHYRSEPESARRTLELLLEAGGEGAVFHADLSEPDAAGRLSSEVASQLGRLDALVHSASVWIEKPVAQVTGADWDKTFSVGPRAGFFLAQAAYEALASSEGAVLFVSDVAATKAWPRHVPHAAAKAALEALVRNLAVAMAPEVRVNGLAPGIVLPPDDLSADDVERLVARTPLRRIVPVEDLVSMALMLVANRSVTGQVVAVDAGRSVV